MAKKRSHVQLLALTSCFWGTTSFSSPLTIQNSGNSLPQGSCGRNKRAFLESLEHLDTLNEASKERTSLLNQLIEASTIAPLNEVLEDSKEKDLTLEQPGRWSNMQPVASGDWKVIYAPHMSTMARIAGGGSFDVTYSLNPDGTMSSHADLRFNWIKPRTILSVSGTYCSESDEVCRVDFDQAWVTTGSEQPISSIEAVESSLSKEIINRLGQAAFIPQLSIFPISFLDNDLIVFDFELLGTRICARKQ